MGLVFNPEGTFTALITPFRQNEEIDEDSLEKLVRFNIEHGISGLVPCGTTGESSALNHEEHDRVIRLVVEYAKDQVLILAGTGSNCTREAIRLTQQAEKSGADASLLITPYCNNPNQEGLYRHFKAVAEHTSLPIIIYNIPKRTGVNLEISTLLRLLNNCYNIKGIKEASGNIKQIEETINRTRDFPDFSVLSGDDNLTLEVIKRGGKGVISVVSNLVPYKVQEMVNLALERNYEKAERLHEELSPLFKAAFITTNPIPIKHMLYLKQGCQEVYRLPMCEMSDEQKREVRKVMEEAYLL